jgi:hypothetical protein
MATEIEEEDIAVHDLGLCSLFKEKKEETLNVLL